MNADKPHEPVEEEITAEEKKGMKVMDTWHKTSDNKDFFERNLSYRKPWQFMYFQWILWPIQSWSILAVGH
jgi:hypothetical protein